MVVSHANAPIPNTANVHAPPLSEDWTRMLIAERSSHLSSRTQRWVGPGAGHLSSQTPRAASSESWRRNQPPFASRARLSRCWKVEGEGGVEGGRPCLMRPTEKQRKPRRPIGQHPLLPACPAAWPRPRMSVGRF